MKAPVLLLLVPLLCSALAGPANPGVEQRPPPPSDDFTQVQLLPGHPDLDQVALPPLLPRPATIQPQPGSPDVSCSDGVSCSRFGLGSVLATFPPAHPDTLTAAQLCAPGLTGPRYTDLPKSSHAHLLRQANALASFDSAVKECCQRPEPLGCAKQAWSDTLQSFCQDEFGVKTKPFHCCKQRGTAREQCFASDAPQPQPQPEPQPQPHPVSSFPPGQPTSANLRNICQLARFRTPGATDQANNIAILEREYRRCCQGNGNLDCAHAAWRKAMARFCKEKGAIKTLIDPCCQVPLGERRDTCFARQAPYPNYDQGLRTLSLAPLTPQILDILCGQHVLITKRKPVPDLIQALKKPCCSLQGNERVQCAERKKSQLIATLCNTKKDSWKDTEKCCSQTATEARASCFDTKYMADVTLASNAP
ncbi:extracellular matrix protein 1 [Alligator mississippiensis]|uniref:Extracellular matrix protein 1 n=2 Tax=Alligator mississippiensis TaxID=8496 RepID=A0A151MAK7_ALLMI|nr:extracellular matrix protein 1 [Alligator mississippiensis]